jgi:hypothetical protein
LARPIRSVVAVEAGMGNCCAQLRRMP